MPSSVLSCLYDSLLDASCEVLDYMNDVAYTGMDYATSIKGKMSSSGGGSCPPPASGCRLPPVPNPCPACPNPCAPAVPLDVGNMPMCPGQDGVPILCPPDCCITRTLVLSALRQCGGNFVRLAGISGVVAVGMGAYAAHVFYQDEGEDTKYKKEVFDVANRYHFIHSIALLATPLTRCPLMTGSLLLAGIIIFCGTCYMHAFTGNVEVRKMTPYGGMLLIAGWITMLF